METAAAERDLAIRMVSRSSTSNGETYKKTTLKNGLRVVTETIPSVRSISIGVWINVGSRSETLEENGVSHLIEHMLFKGTKNRSAKEIASALESIGGSINAFTSREQTCYTARVLDEHLESAIDVLSDITCRATFTPVNIKREKQVIAEEIKESQDNPSDRIYDIFAETYWNGHPLGRPILGSMENVLAMPRRRILGYLSNHYRSDSIVICAAGSVSHQKLVRLVRKYFEFPSGSSQNPEAATYSAQPKLHIEEDDNQQTHICIGHPGVQFDSPNRITSVALSTYLGGGMSSVLFQKVREQKGLAYAVYCYNDFYSDAGIVGTYIGTDATHLRQAVDIILKEYARLAKTKLTADQLHRLKAQIKGQITLGMESTSSRMSRLGRQELMIGRFSSLTQILNDVDKITSSSLTALARQCFDNSKLTIAVLGPAESGALDGIGN